MSDISPQVIGNISNSAACEHQSSWKKRLLCRFSEFAGWSAVVIGSASAFVVATLSVIVWAATGPMFHYSDTWQLIINTGTTLVTFLAVFLIQHSQNRDGKAIQLKLDELIRSTQQARNKLIDLEHCTDEEIEHLQREFAKHRNS
ncbi:MAG: low affinity iron permease family protein [Proteobacteria bacterium]|nr:low affinity iron permease family protein [Pseudomonadota bacterium]